MIVLDPFLLFLTSQTRYSLFFPIDSVVVVSNRVSVTAGFDNSILDYLCTVIRKIMVTVVGFLITLHHGST